MPSNSELKGRIVETHKDGLRILWSFVPEMPSEEDRKSLPWMVVISWGYDGSQKDGMPDSGVNESMMALDAVLGEIERPMFCFEAYRRVGNGLREFVFYVVNCDSFIGELNRKLESHARYPIDIKFYNDENWSDFQQLLDDLGAVQCKL